MFTNIRGRNSSTEMSAGTLKCNSVPNRQILQQDLRLQNRTVHISWSLHSEDCRKVNCFHVISILLFNKSCYVTLKQLLCSPNRKATDKKAQKVTEEKHS